MPSQHSKAFRAVVVTEKLRALSASVPAASQMRTLVPSFSFQLSFTYRVSRRRNNEPLSIANHARGCQAKSTNSYKYNK